MATHRYMELHVADQIQRQVQRWKSKATRYNETKVGKRDGDLEKKTTEGSSSSSEAIQRAVEQ